MGQSLPSLTHLWVWNSNPIITWNHPVLKNWITIDQTIKTSTEINSVLLWEENPNSNTETTTITEKDRIIALWKKYSWEYDYNTEKYSLNWIEFDWIDEVFEKSDFCIAIVYSIKTTTRSYKIYIDNAKTISNWAKTINAKDKRKTIIDLKEWKILNWTLDYINLKTILMEKDPVLLKYINNAISHQ